MTWRLIHADCVEAMRELGEASVDAIVTDPPYGLEFMGKEWDRLGDVRQPGDPTFHGTDTPNGRSKVRYGYNVSLGAMQAWHQTWAEQALRVLKPGGHLLSFGGTRTYHRLACALEDAGFEIRDCLAYLYGSGFPKSLNVSKDQRFCHGHEGESDGEPATERDLRPMRDADVSAAVDAADQRGEVLLEGVSEPGTPATGRTQLSTAEVRLGQSSLEGWGDPLQEARPLPRRPVRPGSGVGEADGSEGRLHHGAPAGDRGSGGTDADSDGGRQPRRSQPGEQRPGEPGTVADEPRPQDGRAWPLCPRCSQPLVPPGLGTALKPAFEPIVLARKPLSGTVAANVLEFGTGALNVDGTRIGTPSEVKPQVRPTTDENGASWSIGEHTPFHYPADGGGRWPANVLLDADAAAALDEQSGERPAGGHPNHRGPDGERSTFGEYGGGANENIGVQHTTGGASRFFYTAKTSRAERENGVAQYGEAEPADVQEYGSIRSNRGAGYEKASVARNNHPTVKPVDLMQWLCRLITPPKGLILDPFTGSGSTGIAALREGFSFIGIEREADYVEIARARIIGDAPLFNAVEA